LKTLDRVEVTAAAPLAAAPVAPPPPPAQVTNAVIGGSFAGNSAAGNSAAGNSAAGQNAIPARGPYANQQNNSGQNALSFVQKSEAPPVPAPQVAAGAAGAARVMAKISLPKPEIPVRIEKGVLSISIDAELTWQAIKTPEAVVSAKFADPLNGEMLSVTRVVYRTKDGGKTWVK
jgi:ankyrin repeat protein